MRAVVRQALALLIFLSAAHYAWAEENPADAIAIGHSALELYEEGRYQSALTLFRRADAVAHSPVFALYVARCQRNMGSFLAARASYRAVLDESLDEQAPEPWKRAQEAARDELSELAARIPSVVIEASFVPSAVKLDGESIPLAELGRELELDPGPHRVEVRGASGTVHRPVRLEAGERRVRVLFDEDPVASGKAAPAQQSTSKTVAAERPSDESGPSAAVVVPLVIGTAGIAVGVTTGLVALFKSRNLKADCPNDICDLDDRSRRDAIHAWANVSTIAFAVGGAGLAIGGVLYLTGAGESSSSRRVGFLLKGELP
jgi:hypothetical protein